MVQKHGSLVIRLLMTVTFQPIYWYTPLYTFPSHTQTVTKKSPDNVYLTNVMAT